MGPEERSSAGGGDGSADLSARGGPGTFRGTDYQLRFAVRQALDLIERQALAPHTAFAVTLERLLVEGANSENWDVVTEPPPVAYEAKIKPSADDIRGWLRDAARAPAERTMVLVFGERAGTTHRAVEKLAELAGASGDAARFDRYVSQATQSVRQLRDILGAQAYDVARRLRFENVPGALLDQDIERRARALAGDRGDDLISMLIDRFSAGAGARVVHPVRALIEDAAGRSITLTMPATSLSRLVNESARRALVMLRAAGGTLPAEVLERAIGVAAGSLPDRLRELQDSGVLIDAGDGRIALVDTPLPIAAPDAAPLAALALSAMLDWLDVHRDSAASTEQDIDAALTLCEQSHTEAPEAVARSFRVLDKRLKRRGDKHLVLEAADRAIAAARAAQQSTEIVEAEAHALICGRSWAYQRVGQLEQARSDGEASLQLGKDIGWDLNTAYCNKCLGRVCRLEALSQRGSRRTALLEQSIANLHLAIDQFTDLSLEEEVGDAYSLLARSLLSAGRLADARAAVDEAQRRLIDPNNKDFFDLLIVRGDVLAADGKCDDAIELYNAVIDQSVADTERGEIRARALHARGAAHRGARRRDQARHDFQAAADAYTDLHEFDWAAVSQLEVLQLDGRLPTRDGEPDIARLLEDEPPLVQVIAIELHEAARASSPPLEGALAYRAAPTVGHWRQQIRKAQKIAAQRRERW